MSGGFFLDTYVFIRTNHFLEKMSAWQRFWITVFPSKSFCVKEIEFSNGDKIGIVPVPEKIKLKSISKSIAQEFNGFDKVCLFDDSFSSDDDDFFTKPGFYLIPNVQSNKEAKYLFNEIFVDKLVTKAISKIPENKKINFGISIENRLQLSEILTSIIAKNAEFLSIRVDYQSESLDEYLDLFAKEYGLESLVSVGGANALFDCDVVLGFDLSKVTKLKRDAIVVDVRDTFKNKSRRKLISGFDFEIKLKQTEDTDVAKLFELVRRRIGKENLLLFLSAKASNPPVCEFLYHYWIRNIDKKQVAFNSKFCEGIATGFAQIGYVTYTII